MNVKNNRNNECGIEMTLNMYLNGCKYNQNNYKYKNELKKIMKQKKIWTHQQDEYLKKIILTSNNNVNWAQLTSKFNQIFTSNPKTQSQCQLRYINNINYYEHQSFRDWSIEQTNLLFKLFKMWGSKWTKIAQQMHGKTQNCVKNRFYGSLRKTLRKLNRASKNLTKKFKKQLKYQSITRIIDASQGLFRLYSPLKQQSEELSKKILCLAQQNSQQMPSNRAQQLIIEINKFNMATRSYKSKKKIKNNHSYSKRDKNFYNLHQSINNNQKQIKNNPQILNLQHRSNSTQQQNQDFTYVLLSKSSTTVDFPFEQENKLKDYQFQEDEHHKKKKALQSTEELFAQAHSPLQCQLWI